MPRRTYTPQYRVGRPGPVWVRGDLIDQLLRWLTGIRLPNGGSVDYHANGINISVPPSAGVPSVYVKLTGGKDLSGFYVGDVYGDGVDTAATEEDASVRLLGFDVDISDAQGYYLATAVSGSETHYEVAGQIPQPPASGLAYLRADSGVLRWIEPGQCGVSGSA